MPFLMSEFAKGAEAVIQPQRDALALQFEGATLQDSIQTSHNKAQLSGLQLQQFVTDMKDSAGYKEDLNKLAPSLKAMSPEETTKAIEALAMKHGASPESILKMEELAIKTKEDKAHLEELNWQNQQHQFEAISGSIDSMTPDQFRENVSKLKQQMPNDQRIDTLFKAANDPKTDINKVKEQAKQTLLTEQQRAEVRREAEQKKRDDETRRWHEEESRERSATLNRLIAADKDRKEDREETHKERDLLRSQVAEGLADKRLQSIVYGAARTPEYKLLQDNLVQAKKNAEGFHPFSGGGLDDKVKQAEDNLNGYQAKIASQQKKVIEGLVDKNAKERLKEAYPELYSTHPKAAVPGSKESASSGVPSGSSPIGKTPEGKTVYQAPDGKNYVED